MANAARIVERARQFIQESLVMFRVCDVIWDEYPAATRLADASARAAEEFATFFQRLVPARFWLDDLRQLHEQDQGLRLLRRQLNIVANLYSRRVLEWNDEFRRRHYQNEHQFNIVADFLEVEQWEIQNFLRFYIDRTGGPFMIGVRDQIALTRFAGPARSHELAPLPWPALTAEERMAYGLAGEPRVWTRETRIEHINGMILNEHRAFMHDDQIMVLPHVDVQLRNLRRALGVEEPPEPESRFQDMNTAGSDPFDCPTCFETQDPAAGAQYVRTDCGHRFCLDCIRNWVEVQMHPSCPMCRRTI